MNTRNTFELPRRGNHDYLELPPQLQQLLEALYHAEQMSGALDSADDYARAQRLSEHEGERISGRWYQWADVMAWNLLEALRAQAEISYIAYLADRAEQAEYGVPANSTALEAERQQAEERMHTSLLRLVKTSSSLV